MPNAILWDDPIAESTVLSTGLNSLANGARAISSAEDNETNKYRFCSFELYVNTQGSARSSGAYCAIYIVTSVDGTNFGFGDASTAPPANTLVATLPFDAATTARYQTTNLIPLPPLQFKVILANQTGQAFNASSNTVKITYYGEEIQ